MAASKKVPQSHVTLKSGILVLYGYGIRVQVSAGHLLLHDGIADERRTIRLPRVSHGLKRLVMIGSDGFITLEALRWLSDVGAAFVMLDRRGKVIAFTGPVAPFDAKLRRAQSLALGNGTALKVSKELISQKLAGQELLVREMLQISETADAIARFRNELPRANSIEAVRLIEAQAARFYWQSWSDVPIRWPRRDEGRIAEHWKRFGARISALTHGPRLATSPGNACLNFVYSILEAESTLALSAMGLLPEIGLLHSDTPNRNSLSCDLMEVCRPKCDAFVLNWLQNEPLRKADFWEDRNGNCRLASSLAIRLSETSDTWRKLIAPVAEYVAQEIWSSVSRPASKSKIARQLIATRLTQRNKREVKGSDLPEVKQPKLEHMCGNCGVKIRRGKKLCLYCAKPERRENFRIGREMAQRPEHLARRSETMRTHRRAIQEWQPSDLPAWLTREVYVKEIQPSLGGVTKLRIRSALGVSEPYSSNIQRGKCTPHPRHWKTLAELAGILAG